MKLRSLILLFAKISLAFTFIVICAGSVVRMTGSGMGCPDWPKCFGYIIPPMDADRLTFTPGHTFEKGQMIIVNDTLWVANVDIEASVFNRSEWHKYPKHDYAIFNPLHTWVEYINRLSTVLYAFPILILSVLCLICLIREKDWITFFLALFTDIMIGYEIWLGKLVVDGNLKENSITYHMFGSIAIVSLLLLLIYRHRKNKTAMESTPVFRWLLMAMLLLVFLQVILGTQVREEVDLIARSNDDRSSWIDALPSIFKVHRSFSILISALALVILFYHKKMKIRITTVNWMFFFLLLEVIAGIVLSYFAMPAQAQPLHLFFGILLFATSFYSVRRVFGKG